ncbi:MAG: Hsp70 family protein [Nostocales cyanobacterium 94392]|nr:Hsp70 family protein [Nostocales cyanobacterium 94392]
MVKDPNQLGFSIPSSIYITESGEIRVGHVAEDLRQLNPSFYRREFKRDLGTKTPYTLGNKQIYPEELAVQIIRELKNEANEMIQGMGLGVIDKAVITVPATYQSYKKQLMEEAGKNAGFQQVELLDEPIAAAIYYTKNYKKPTEINPEEIILVYDLGGGTFDATLIQKQKDIYVTLSTPVGLAHCGGIDFDRKIFEDVYNQCNPQLQALLNRRNQTSDAELSRLLISDFCRDFKHQLGDKLQHEKLVILPSVSPVKYSLDRDSFNRMIYPLIAETIEQCHRLVQNAGIKWEQVDQVLLVGGSCRIPYVKSVVETEFKRPVFRVDDPELAVCQGAAIYGADLDEKPSSVENTTPGFYEPGKDIWDWDNK